MKLAPQRTASTLLATANCRLLVSVKAQLAIGTFARSAEIFAHIFGQHAAGGVDAVHYVRPGSRSSSGFLAERFGRNAIGLHEIQAYLDPNSLARVTVRKGVFDFGSVVANADKIKSGGARGF